MLVPKHTYTHTHMYMRNKLTFEKRVNNFKEKKNGFEFLLCKVMQKKRQTEKISSLNRGTIISVVFVDQIFWIKNKVVTID